MAQASLHEPTNEEPNPFDPPISLAPLKVFRSEASPLHSPRSPAAARVQSTEEDYAEVRS